MARGMDDTPVHGEKKKWSDFVDKFEWKKNAWHQVRFFGDVITEYRHTIKTKTGKYYPEYCHGFNVEEGDFYPDKEARCPCCALLAKNPEIAKGVGDLKITDGFRYYMNLIDLEIAEAEPAKPKAIWTPIRLIDVSPTLFSGLKGLKGVNSYGTGSGELSGMSFSIDNAKHGAIVQIKQDPDADATKMYNTSMDTKLVALTEKQQSYTVQQKYPDGTSKIVRGKDGLPAQFEYVRCVNSRDDMVKSLRRNGYYGDQEDVPSSSSITTTGNRKPATSYTREEKVAQVDAETPIETLEMDEDVKSFIAEDEEPAPKKVVEKPKSNEPYDDCPTSFGEFANAVECFTKCGVMEKCREATELAETKKTSKTPPATKKVKEDVQPDDDDDSV